MVFTSCQYDVWNFVSTLILGSGFLVAIVTIFLKANRDRRLFLYSKVYSDSILVIKTLYRDLVNVESGLDYYLSRKEPFDEEKQKDWRNKTVSFFDSFKQKFGENEIIFSDSEVKIINKILDLINEAKSIHTTATLSEDSEGSDFRKESLSKKADLYKNWKPRFLNYKKDLKNLFQSRYRLIFE